MTHLREISDREEVPNWASTLRAALEDMGRRIDRVTSSRRSLGESVPATRQMRSRTPSGYDPDLQDGRVALNTEGQRQDALRQQNAQLHELRGMLSKALRQPTSAERNQLAHAFNRADSVYASLGRQTPVPLPGESPMAFRHRLADGLRDMSGGIGKVNLDALPDDVFGSIEARVYQDAADGAKAGLGTPAGRLNSRSYKSEGGHNMTEYFGDPLAWMSPFMLGGQRVTINRHPKVA